MAAEQAAGRAGERTTERLRVLFCDHLNIARGKWLPLRDANRGGSARFCRSVFGVAYDKELLPAPGAEVGGGLPDLEAVYAAEAIRPGWVPGERVVVADLFDNHGRPLALSARAALVRAIDAWRARGLEPMVGIELEAYAYRIQPDGSLAPYDTPSSHVYCTGAFADPAGFTDAIWQVAEAAGFRMDSLHTEYDSPQFEFTLTYDRALKAIDDIFLFRLLAREVAFRHGIQLTFLPKPIAARGGSGVHVNFSFKDAEGRNAIVGGGNPARMNAVTRGAVAGLMTHHAALAGLAAPCVNSYARLKPASMSGYWRNWAVDHRGVTVRLGTEEGASARLEHRMGDGAANPYTLVAAVLQAARLGVENNDALPPAETGDSFERNDATEGVAEDLGGALDALAADRALVAAVGEELVANHIAIKRNEVAKLAGRDPDAVRDYYIRHV